MALIAAMLRPGLPTFSAQTRLLVVAPHPDDETIATGLLIQQVRVAGGEVRILLLTAGDNNPWPQRWLERRLWIGVAARRRWGRRRCAEMLHALACLDLPEQALQPMGWPDMGVTDVLLGSHGQAASSVADVIDTFQPNLIAMPSLNDRHPDHGSAHVLLRLALVGRSTQPRLIGYLVHGKAGRHNWVEIGGSAAQLAKKRAALEAHRSQMALSGRRMRRLASRPERFEGISGELERFQAALPWQPAAWLRPWLHLSVVGLGGTQTWRWRDAPLKRDPAGRFHLCPVLASTASPSPCFVRLALSFPALWIFDRWGWHELG